MTRPEGLDVETRANGRTVSLDTFPGSVDGRVVVLSVGDGPEAWLPADKVDELVEWLQGAAKWLREAAS